MRTKTAETMLHQDRFVVIRIDPGVEQTLDHARENLAATMLLCGGLRRPLLVDISRCRPISPEVRHYYTGPTLLEYFVAVALLVEASPLGRMMGNIYLRVARLGIPARLFSEEHSAFDWLRRFAA